MTDNNNNNSYEAYEEFVASNYNTVTKPNAVHFEVNRTLLLVLGVVLAVAILFTAGFGFNVALSHRADAVAAAEQKATEDAQEERLEEESNDLREWKKATAASNINRDIAADAYAVRIGATSAIAGNYQKAKMCNTLDPDTICVLYQQFTDVADEIAATYYETYSLSCEREKETLLKWEAPDSMSYASQCTAYHNIREAVHNEQAWKAYNEQELASQLETMKTEVFKQLSAGELF